MKNHLIPILLLMLCCACSSDEPANPEEKLPETPTDTKTLVIKQELSADESRAAEQIKGFNLKFFQAVNASEKADKNIVCSPLSASILLSMLANATDETATDEIVAVLGSSDLDALNSLNKKYLDLLPEVDPTARLGLANAVWYENGYTLNPGFEAVASDFYNTENFETELQTNDPAVIAQINKWVENKTEGLIEEIIDYLPKETIAILANALYFKGAWANPFDAKETEKKEFKGIGGTSTVDMMYKHGMQHYAQCEAYQAVKMEFGNGAYEALLVLPAEGTDINAFVGGDALASLSTIRFNDEIIDFHYPKFKIEPGEKFDLETPLTRMGIKTLWLDCLKNLFTIPDGKRITIEQKATIEFTEEGAEGAAVTWALGVLLDFDVKPTFPLVNFNRPFVFLINETSTGATIFAGKVVDL